MKVMYYTYVLRSKKDDNLYVGHTNDLARRLEEHNSGEVRSTSSRRPFYIVRTEMFSTRSEARWRERYLKTASGKEKLNRSLNDSVPL